MKMNKILSKAMSISLLIMSAECAKGAYPGAANALPLALGGDDMEKITSGEVITRNSDEGEDVASLTPSGTPLNAVLSDAPRGKAGFAVASASFIPCEKSTAELYNALLSVSTQKGITYISRREGMKSKVLFNESYFVDNYKKGASFDSLNGIDDPKVIDIPASEVRYAYQEDSSFGGNVYRYDISCNGNVLNAHITNETAMKYHGITCLKEGELSMFVQIAPADGGVIVNTAAIITGHKSKIHVLVVSVDLASSFSRRTRALHDWYKAQTAK